MSFPWGCQVATWGLAGVSKGGMHIDKFEGEAEGERAGLCTAATRVAYMFVVIGSIGVMRCAFIGARLQGAAVGSGFGKPWCIIMRKEVGARL